MYKFASPFMAKSTLLEEKLTNKQKKETKKIAKKAVKSQDKRKQAEEIEGRHGYGANKKSKRKNAAADRKKAKVKESYKKMSAAERSQLNLEYQKKIKNKTKKQE